MKYLWEDTVMTQYQKDCALKLFLKEHPQYKGLNLWKPVARHQAEITWKAGIREVFDFFHDNSAGIMMNEHALEAKLKEWGLE